MNKAYLQMGITASLGTMVLLAVALLFSGCGEETEGDICTLNEVQTCPCIGGGEGAQACAEDRQGWGQ